MGPLAARRVVVQQLNGLGGDRLRVVLHRKAASPRQQCRSWRLIGTVKQRVLCEQFLELNVGFPGDDVEEATNRRARVSGGGGDFAPEQTARLCSRCLSQRLLVQGYGSGYGRWGSGLLR